MPKCAALKSGSESNSGERGATDEELKEETMNESEVSVTLPVLGLHGTVPFTEAECTLLMQIHEAYIEYGAKMYRLGRVEAVPPASDAPAPTLSFDGTSYDCAKCGNRQVVLCEHWQALFERAYAAIEIGRADTQPTSAPTQQMGEQRSTFYVPPKGGVVSASQSPANPVRELARELCSMVWATDYKEATALLERYASSREQAALDRALIGISARLDKARHRDDISPSPYPKSASLPEFWEGLKLAYQQVIEVIKALKEKK